MKISLTKSQKKALEQIQNPKTLTPDIAYQDDVWTPPHDITGPDGFVWKKDYVYGTFNTHTIKALEKRGYIKIHEIGGLVYSDIVEVLK